MATTTDMATNITTTDSLTTSAVSDNPSASSMGMTTLNTSSTSLSSVMSTGLQASDGLFCEIDPDKCQALQTVKLVLLSISFICAVLTLATALLFRKVKRFSQRIFLQILLANIIEDITYLAHDGRVTGSSCIAQGFFIQFAGFVLFLWIVSLTIYLFLIIVREKERIQVESFEWLFVLCCWVGPLAIATLPLITDDYGPASAPYCWIREKDSGQVWRYLIYWVPVMGGIVGILATFIYMYWKTKQNLELYNSQDTQVQRSATLMNLKKKYLKPLTYLAASFVVLHLFQFINRIQNTVNDIPLFPLMLLHVISQFGYGLVLCALFFSLNGTSEFTKLKLTESLNEYKEYGLFKKEDTVTPYSVDYEGANGSASSRPNSYLSVRGNSPNDDKPTLRISYIDDEENSQSTNDLPIGDIRTYDITRLDTISLDSQDSQHKASDTRK